MFQQNQLEKSAQPSENSSVALQFATPRKSLSAQDPRRLDLSEELAWAVLSDAPLDVIRHIEDRIRTACDLDT